VEFCHEHGISVIPGGCPCMFGATSDPHAAVDPNAWDAGRGAVACDGERGIRRRNDHHPVHAVRNRRHGAEAVLALYVVGIGSHRKHLVPGITQATVDEVRRLLAVVGYAGDGKPVLGEELTGSFSKGGHRVLLQTVRPRVASLSA
jgi:hypothetical protein